MKRTKFKELMPGCPVIFRRKKRGVVHSIQPNQKSVNRGIWIKFGYNKVSLVQESDLKILRRNKL